MIARWLSLGAALLGFAGDAIANPRLDIVAEAAMAAALTAAGAQVSEAEDGLIIEGTGGEALRGSANARIKTHLDHRIAMSMAVAGLASRDGVEIDDTRPIATSFPAFEALLEEITR